MVTSCRQILNKPDGLENKRHVETWRYFLFKNERKGDIVSVFISRARLSNTTFVKVYTQRERERERSRAKNEVKFSFFKVQLSDREGVM